MHFEFLVEEPSAETALTNFLPRILPRGHTFAVHPFQGKPDLLQKLPVRLKGYRRWLPKEWRIVVLVDEDRENCFALKKKLERTAVEAGLTTKTSVKDKRLFQVLNRLAIEELEAWFFGDLEALCAAYPRLPATLRHKAKYRNPDEIAGGTWEALERELRKSGYYPSGMPKIEVARNISRHMNVEQNRSRSFQVFKEGLMACIC